MKKYLLLIFTMFFLVALTSCDVNSYEENSWYSDDKLKECLVEDLPEIQNVEYVKKNDEDVYFYMNSNDYNSYVNIIYNYLKSLNFEYLGTKGDAKASLAGMLSTYYFKEANTLEEFRTDGDGSDYTFVYSDGTLDGSRVVFNIIKFYRDDNSTLEYKNKKFNHNTFMVVRHYSESPLGGIPMLKDEEIEDEIINAYVEKYELLETPTIGQLFNSFVKDGKEVVPFIMGEHGDAMVWSETVANIYFYYPDHRRIEVYYDNAIYTLQEAYNQGILTQQNLIDIAKEDDYDCKMGHSWNEGELTQVPGGGEIMLYTCLVCGERKTEDIHNDIGYACDVTITGEIDSLIENGYIVPQWDYKTIVQKYSSFTYSNIRYTIFSTEIKDGINPKYVGNKVDDIIVDGIDVYNKDEKYSINAEIYEIKNVYKECAYAIKFEGDKEYYSYLNTNYEFETLGDFIEKLNLKEYLQFGTASYKNDIVYKDFDDSIVWDMLLSDYSLVNTSLTNNNYKNPLMSISSNIESLGIENVSLAVNDEGYIQTNILGTAKTFYIGEERVNNFVDYIINNIPKKNLFR